MARIDPLPEGAKSVLQVGAVMGREWSETLLREVAGLAEPDLTAHLAALTDAELLYARGVPPQTTYVFKHAFTQDAAYRGLLTTRRQELHHRVAVTLEALFPDRLEEHYGCWRTTTWRRRRATRGQAIAQTGGAAVMQMALLAYAEAVRFYHLALQALERQEAVDEAQRCTLLLALGEAQLKAGEHLEAQETLLRAADIARALGTETLVRGGAGARTADASGRSFCGSGGAPARGSAAGLGAEDSLLTAKTLGGLARALRVTGAQQQALVYAQQAVAMARRLADPELLATNLEGMLYALQGPEHCQQRLAYATEMLQLAKAANVKNF